MSFFLNYYCNQFECKRIISIIIIVFIYIYLLALYWLQKGIDQLVRNLHQNDNTIVTTQKRNTI